MKSLVLFSFLIAAFSTPALADGAWTTRLLCTRGTTDSSQKVEIQSSSEGVFRARVTMWSIAVGRDSGWVQVAITSQDMPMSVFENKDAGFSILFGQSFGMGEGGRMLGAVLGGTFKDTRTGLAIRVVSADCN